MGDEDRAAEFRAAVAEMRIWQKKYFNTGRDNPKVKQYALEQACYYEKQVDNMLAPRPKKPDVTPQIGLGI